MMDRTFLAGLHSGVEIRVSELVPELVSPPPCKTVRELDVRRTDFGRHFRADTFVRGGARPAPQPRPGYFMLNGVCHMHPKVFAMMQEAFKTPFKLGQPLRYVDGVVP